MACAKLGRPFSSRKVKALNLRAGYAHKRAHLTAQLNFDPNGQYNIPSRN